MERYINKFGNDRAQAIVKQLQTVGRKEDINFSYGGSTGNTLDAHRLITYARENIRNNPQISKEKREDTARKVQNDLMELLFEAYFEKEQDISIISNLTKIAAKLNLDPNEVSNFLNTQDLLSEQVFQEAQSAVKRFRVSGVPHFLLTNNDGPTYALSGAQEAGVFMEAFEEIAHE